jgi:hypothetical protein
MAWIDVGARPLAIALGMGCVGLTQRAWADPASAARRPSWLEWQGPLECQNTREVERELASLLGHDPELDRLPPTRVTLGWSTERGWMLQIRVLLPGGERQRDVDVHTCLDGFDVVALTLALILDPSLQAGADAAADVASAAASTAASEAAETSTEASAPLPDPSTQTPGSAPPEPAPLAPPSTELAPANAPGVSERAAPPFALALSASGRIDLGSLPTALYGGGIELTLGAGDWRFDTGAGLIGRSGIALPNARYAVSYSDLFGVLRGCREFHGERGGYFGTCAGGQLGALAASEQDGARRQAHGLWAAADLGAELGVDLSSRWNGYGRLELAFPLVRHEFALVGGSVAYALPPVTVQLSLGVAVTLTDWGSP